MTYTTSTDADEFVACCIAGCGPAGAVLGLLLARAGIEVLVLEKHADFLRDFRGDTIHPSTLEVLEELGLAKRFLQLPHTEVPVMSIRLPGGEHANIDFGRLGGRYPFIAFVPQWDFLDFVTSEAERYPNFRLVRNAEVVDLLEDHDARVCGVRYRTRQGERTAGSLLTIGADGRSSRTRAAAGLPLVETSPPMDVLWFRLLRRPEDEEGAALYLAPGRIVGLFNRADFWQVAYVIPKGAYAAVRAAGLEALQRSIAEAVPQLSDRVSELRDWDQIKLLTVRADRLRRWYRPGFLAIGDAAHAMSPVAGVGINVAVQDAVVAANLLWQPLRRQHVSVATLARIQRQRELTVRLIQAMQALVQDRVLEPALEVDGAFRMPLAVRLLISIPWLRNLPARLVAYGLIRPHVRVPELAAPVSNSGGVDRESPRMTDPARAIGG
jgi:2-polyprenyl-6-methoxyphenol hydroxylase-like FAD-dependent oxidoreductase